MSSVAHDSFFASLPDIIFDDLDLDSIEIPEGFESDFDINDFIHKTEDTPDLKQPHPERKNSTLKNLLKTVPLTGYVPPAPQIYMENNCVIESKSCAVPHVLIMKNDVNPHLKNALGQEKVSCESSQPHAFDRVDCAHASGLQYVLAPASDLVNCQPPVYHNGSVEMKYNYQPGTFNANGITRLCQ